MSITTWILIIVIAIPASAVVFLMAWAVLGWRMQPRMKDDDMADVMDITRLTLHQQLALTFPWSKGRLPNQRLFKNSDDTVNGKRKGVFRVSLIVSRNTSDGAPTWMSTGTYLSEKNNLNRAKPKNRAQAIMSKKAAFMLEGVGEDKPRPMIVEGGMAVQFFMAMTEEELEYFYKLHPDWKEEDANADDN